MTWNNAWQDFELIPAKKDITDYLLEDELIANSLNDIIESWTKEISDWEWWSITVPDYRLRLKWIEMSLKLKGHFREKRTNNWLIDWIYKLV